MSGQRHVGGTKAGWFMEISHSITIVDSRPRFLLQQVQAAGIRSHHLSKPAVNSPATSITSSVSTASNVLRASAVPKTPPPWGSGSSVRRQDAPKAQSGPARTSPSSGSTNPRTTTASAQPRVSTQGSTATRPTPSVSSVTKTTSPAAPKKTTSPGKKQAVASTTRPVVKATTKKKNKTVAKKKPTKGKRR